MSKIRSVLLSAAAGLVLVTPGVAVAETRTPQPPPPPPPGFCPAVDADQAQAPSVFRYGLSEEQLKSEFYGEDGLEGSGYRPLRLTGYEEGGRVRFATRWAVLGGPDWRVRQALTGAQLTEEITKYKKDFRMTDLSGFNTPAGTRYNVIWERNLDGVDWRFHLDQTRIQMQDLVNKYKTQGFVPQRVEGSRGAGGELRFVSTWVAKNSCQWQMHNRMTAAQYQAKADEYADDGYRLVHVDATVEFGTMYYHGIWSAHAGPGPQVWADRDWYRFQRELNNYWCEGYEITNFYGTDTGGGAGDTPRFGGIWTFDSPLNIDDTSPLADRVREEVNCAQGRAGAAVVNLTTGEAVYEHADQVFGTSSTIKSAILYALLRKADDEGFDINEVELEVGDQYGSNQQNAFGDDEDKRPLHHFAEFMIAFSNNWATNRLIDYLGMDTINHELEKLGLHHTRLNRYMTGDGAPSAHGNDDPEADYIAGWDNVTTPREWADFLSRMNENGGLLSPSSHARFWQIMATNGTDDDTVLDAGVGNDWNDVIDAYKKAGSNAWAWDKSTDPWTPDFTVDFAALPQIGPHLQRSEGGKLDTNGQVIVYATFINEADNLATYDPLNDTLDCIVVEVARQYSGQTTGAVLPQCT